MGTVGLLEATTKQESPCHSVPGGARDGDGFGGMMSSASFIPWREKRVSPRPPPSCTAARVLLEVVERSDNEEQRIGAKITFSAY